MSNAPATYIPAINRLLCSVERQEKSPARDLVIRILSRAQFAPVDGAGSVFGLAEELSDMALAGLMAEKERTKRAIIAQLDAIDLAIIAKAQG